LHASKVMIHATPCPSSRDGSREVAIVRAETEAPGPCPRGHPSPPLQPPDRGRLRRLDPAFHLLPRCPPPGRDGRCRDQPVPDRCGVPRPRPPPDPDPGVLCLPFPLSAVLARPPGEDSRRRPGEPDPPLAGGSEPGGSSVGSFFPG